MDLPPAYAPPYGAGEGGSSTADQSSALAFLASRGFPPGLSNTILRSVPAFGRRFWLVDNSGSMSAPDGHRLEIVRGSEQLVSCSRWTEVEDMLRFHADMAAALDAPCQFRFLNQPRSGSQSVVVRAPTDVPSLMAACASGPAGGTPLCAHVRQIAAEIAQDEARLRAAGQQALLVIVTDGLPTDGDLAAAMAPLGQLPVWVVVRLCTDEPDVLAFWSNLDAVVEVDMDVLDDLQGEAAECARHNGWLTYAPCLHRLREWGAHCKLLDLLDERRLAPVEVRELLSLVLGGGPLPHPEADLHGFLAQVDERQQGLAQPFNPTRSRRTPWIDARGLRRAVDQRWCVIA